MRNAGAKREEMQPAVAGATAMDLRRTGCGQDALEVDGRGRVRGRTVLEIHFPFVPASALRPHLTQE